MHQQGEGMKVWVFADSKNGCTYDIKVYTGKEGKVSMYGLAYDVITRFCKSLSHEVSSC